MNTTQSKSVQETKHFVSLESLSLEEIMGMIEESLRYKQGDLPPLFNGKTVANLFFENSTRTKNSFQMAERHLSIQEIPFDVTTSSVTKGETLYDTCKTLEAIGVNALVIRHPEAGYYHELVEKLNIPVLNGGDGSGEHPSQSLLDLVTIFEEFKTFQGLNVAICGDLVHSRVARSNASVLKRLGANVVGCSPESWWDDSMGLERKELDDVLATCDVIMLLRVQHERHIMGDIFSKEEYHERYGLTVERVAKMKDGAIIMHPAPVNRDVEIAGCLIEHDKSRIFPQMTNGVYARMAILNRALGGQS
ncbi:aspartate carbamoyltransferase catalytic subunit [Exiguobacterium algae]|uniref:aspartate carbamoyltransferase catalytic subunit n=1 Tax=Exiguobacterium algae TaxID=2751250 RepID=UPI001BE575D9|nr:aspartate carbamoyltransferase catalytic subunit [Exiguobacterium algae]